MKANARTGGVIAILTVMHAGALALCLVWAAGHGRAAAESPQIWLGGVDPIVRPSLEPNSTSDFIDLFDPKAQWSKAASRVKVFLTSSQFFSGVRVVERCVDAAACFIDALQFKPDRIFDCQ